MESRQYLTATVADPGFEAIGVGTGYAYDPAGSAWVFSGDAGVTGNSSPFTSGNPNAPQGTQVAFLQSNGSMTQAIAGWSAGSYQLSFLAAQRGNNGVSTQDFQVLVDGNPIGTFTPTGTSYQSFTSAPFTVAAGTHTVEFVGLNTNGDNTAFVDEVQLASAATTTLTGTAGDDSFAAVADGSDVDLYVNATSGSGSPTERIAASALGTLVLAGGGGTDTFTSNVPGLPLSVASGSIQATSDLSLASLYVGPGGTFTHSAGALVTSSLTVASGGTFTDAGGTLAAPSGQTLSVTVGGLFDAGTAASLAGVTGVLAVVNGGTLQADNGRSASATTTVSGTVTTRGSATIDVTAGTLSVPGQIGVAGGATLSLDGPGTLSIPSWTLNGGSVDQTAGTVTTSDLTIGGSAGGSYELAGTSSSLVVSDTLSVGYGPGAAFTMAGGSLSSVYTYVGVGNTGTGDFTQTGGVSSLGYVRIGWGYNGVVGSASLSGGTMTTGELNVGIGYGTGTFDLSGSGWLAASNEYLGSIGGTGTFVQTGGSNSDGGGLFVAGTNGNNTQYGTGTYDLSAGALSANGEILGLDAVDVGASAFGTLTQTGGTNTVGNYGILLGEYRGADGTFQMQGGTLSDAGPLYVGEDDTAASTFAQSGGTARISGALILGLGGPGDLTVTGGTLAVAADAYVGYSAAATLAISGNGSVTDADALYVSGDGTLNDPVGTGTVNLAGSGTLTTGQTYVGYSGPATFDQTGGTDSAGTLVLDSPAGRTANFTVAGGTANITTAIDAYAPAADGPGVVNEGSPYALSLFGTTATTHWGIAWGDTTASAIPGTPPSTPHTYTVGGNTYTIVPTAYPASGAGYVAGSIPVLVNDLPATVLIGGQASTTANPVTLSNNVGQTTTLSATFADPGTGESHTAIVNWGDGNTSTATVTESDGQGTITATHVYMVHRNYQPTLSVSDSGGAIAVVSFAADIAYVAPDVYVTPTTLTAVAGQTATLVLHDDGPEAASAITSWALAWGDGATQTVSSTPATGGTWTVTHVYATAGTYSVTASATDEEGPHDTGGATITAAPVVIAAPTDVAATETLPGEVDLSWSEASANVTDFLISATPVGGGSTLQFTSAGKGESFGATGLTPGVMYSFVVKADNDQGGGLDDQSAPSAAVTAVASADTLSATAPTTSTEGSTFTLALSSSVAQGGPAIVSWSVTWDDSGSTDAVSGPAGSVYHTPAAGAVEATATVRATDSAGKSFDLPAVKVRIDPATPTQISATFAADATSATITWSAQTAIPGTTYEVQRRDPAPASGDGSTSWETVGTVAATANGQQKSYSYADSGLTPTAVGGGGYLYEVTAVGPGSTPGANDGASSTATPATLPTGQNFPPVGYLDGGNWHVYDNGNDVASVTGGWTPDPDLDAGGLVYNQPATFTISNLPPHMEFWFTFYFESSDWNDYGDPTPGDSFTVQGPGGRTWQEVEGQYGTPLTLPIVDQNQYHSATFTVTPHLAPTDSSGDETYWYVDKYQVTTSVSYNPSDVNVFPSVLGNQNFTKGQVSYVQVTGQSTVDDPSAPPVVLHVANYDPSVLQPLENTVTLNAQGYGTLPVLAVGSGRSSLLVMSDAIGNLGWNNFTPAAEVAPAAPSSLSVTSSSPDQVDLAWTDTADDNTEFEVERSTAPTFPAGQTQVIGTTAASTDSFDDATVTPGVPYFYRVLAVEDGLLSAPSMVGGLPAIEAPTDGSSGTLEPIWAGGRVTFHGSPITTLPVDPVKPPYTPHLRWVIRDSSGRQVGSPVDGLKVDWTPGAGGIYTISLTDPGDGSTVGSGTTTTTVTVGSTPPTPPPSVGVLTATASYRFASLTWPAFKPGDGGATTSYQIFDADLGPVGSAAAASGAAPAYTLVDTIPATQLYYFVNDLQPYEAYSFKVEAVDATSTGFAVAPAATLMNIPKPVDVEYLGDSGGEYAAQASGFESWYNTDPTVTHYIVEESDNDGPFYDYSPVQVDNNPTDYGTPYYYPLNFTNKANPHTVEVIAVNATGRSDLTLPATPSGLDVTTPAPDEAKLTWANPASTNADGILVDVSQNGGPFRTLIDLPGTATSYTCTTLAPGTYTFRVRAFNARSDETSNTGAATIYGSGNPALAQAPAAPTASDITTDSATLTWPSMGAGLSYVVEQQVPGATQGTTVFVQVAVVSSPTYSATKLADDTAYTFAVRAIDGQFNGSPPSTPVTFTTLLAPPAAPKTWLIGFPHLPTSDGGDGGYTYSLFWGQVYDASYYEVESFKDGVLATDGTTTLTHVQFPYPADPTGTHVYSFSVRAVNSAGPSAWAGFGSTTRVTAHDNSSPDLTGNPGTGSVPADPTDATATRVSATEYDVTWQDNSDNEDGFYVRRLTFDANGNPLPDGSQWTVGPNVTFFADTSVDVDGTYAYAVSAFNGAGESGASVSGVPDAPTDPGTDTGTDTGTTPTEAVAAPMKLAASTINPGQVQLSWYYEDSAPHDGFVIMRDQGDGNWVQIGTADADQATFTDSDVSAGATYDYYVYATYQGLQSEPSNTATADTAEGLSAPTGLSAEADSSDSVALTWDAYAGGGNNGGFEVDVTDSDGNPVQTHMVSDPAATDCEVDGLDPDTDYAFVIRAIDSSGNKSDPSNEADATTDAVQLTSLTVDVPGLPGVTATADASGQPVDLYVPVGYLQGTENHLNGTIELSVGGLPDGADPAKALWNVAGTNFGTPQNGQPKGDFGDGDNTTVTITPEPNNLGIVGQVTAWYDANGNGQADPGEDTFEVDVHVVQLQQLTVTDDSGDANNGQAVTASDGTTVPTLTVTANVSGTANVDLNALFAAEPDDDDAYGQAASRISYTVTGGTASPQTGTFAGQTDDDAADGVQVALQPGTAGGDYTITAFEDVNGNGQPDVGSEFVRSVEVKVLPDIQLTSLTATDDSDGANSATAYADSANGPPQASLTVTEQPTGSAVIDLSDAVSAQPVPGLQYVHWSISGQAVSPESSGTFAGTPVTLTLTPGDTQYQVFAWLDGTGASESSPPAGVTPVLEVDVHVVPPPQVGITAYRTGDNFGVPVSEAAEDSNDPSQYVVLVNDNYDQDLPDGLPDDSATTAPIQGNQMEVNPDGTPVDPDFGHLTLNWSSAGMTSGKIELTVSDPAAVQLFKGDGTELNDTTLDLAEPTGDLQSLASGSMDVWFEGLEADPDLVISLAYISAAGTQIATDSIHLDVVDYTFLDPTGTSTQQVNPVWPDAVIAAANANPSIYQIDSNPADWSLPNAAVTEVLTGLSQATAASATVTGLDDPSDGVQDPLVNKGDGEISSALPLVLADPDLVPSPAGGSSTQPSATTEQKAQVEAAAKTLGINVVYSDKLGLSAHVTLGPFDAFYRSVTVQQVKVTLNKNMAVPGDVITATISVVNPKPGQNYALAVSLNGTARGVIAGPNGTADITLKPALLGDVSDIQAEAFVGPNAIKNAQGLANMTVFSWNGAAFYCGTQAQINDKWYQQAFSAVANNPISGFSIGRNMIYDSQYVSMYNGVQTNAWAKWDGMAALASYEVGSGLAGANILNLVGLSVPVTGEVPLDLAFALGNGEIYMSMFPEMLAYAQGGINNIATMIGEQIVTQLQTQGWQQISANPNNANAILSGNEVLLQAEQQDVIGGPNGMYTSFPTLFANLSSSLGGNAISSPIPGNNPSFATVINPLLANGQMFAGQSLNIASFAQRWQWISDPTQGMYQSFVKWAANNPTIDYAKLIAGGYQ